MRDVCLAVADVDGVLVDRERGFLDRSGVFQIVLQRLPSEFESVFETLDEAFHSSWLKASVALSSKTERKSRYARSKF